MAVFRFDWAFRYNRLVESTNQDPTLKFWNSNRQNSRILALWLNSAIVNHMDGIQKLKKSRRGAAIDQQKLRFYTINQQIMQISALSEIICCGH